jgi:hypothetical protein
VQTAEKIRKMDEEFLGGFAKSYSKLYQQWKRKDLLVVALETMPKQVKTEDVIDNLIKLKCEFSKRLSCES